MIPERNPTSLLDLVKEYAATEKLNLPVFPRAAHELQKVLSDEKVSIEEIASIIQKDQALAGQMLKLANSAFFSGLSRVRTIKDAILRLGLNQVFSCLVATAQQNLYKSGNSVIDGYLQSLWKHALATAKGSKWLLQKIGYRELSDEAFLAGLLHDIGKLLLLKVIETINAKHLEAGMSEVFIQEILDSMHVEQGFSLLEEWSIPSVYCRVARDHHTEEFDTGDVVLLAVRTVNQICRRTGLSLNYEPIVPATLPEAHALSVKEIVLAELEVVIEDAITLEFGA